MRDIRQLMADTKTKLESATEADPDEKVSGYGGRIFMALQGQSHIYGGTVPPEVVAARRKRNRHARRARAENPKTLAREARSNRVANIRRRFGDTSRFGYTPDPFGNLDRLYDGAGQ